MADPLVLDCDVCHPEMHDLCKGKTGTHRRCNEHRGLEIDLRPPCPDCGAPLEVVVGGFETLERCTNARCTYSV